MGGDTVLRGMSWVSLAALTLASFVPLTQTTSENAGGLRMDPAARERALLAGTGAMSALTAGVLATSFAFSDRGPHWESTGAAIAVTALAPALTYAMNGEWQAAGESLLVGVLAVVMSGLLSVVSAPLMAAQDPDHDFAEVFFRAFALATTAIVPISSVGYAAIRTAEERAAAEPNRDAR